MSSSRSIVSTLARVTACAGIALGASNANAAPVVAGAGFDWAQSANERSTQSVHALIAMPLGSSVVATLAGVRYDDALVGEGLGAIAGIAVSATPATRLRAWISRYAGDHEFRAWRVKAGPELAFRTGGTLGMFYARHENSLGEFTDAAITELGVPLTPAITARASGSYAVTRGLPPAMSGSLGLGWSPIPRFEITGDVGRAGTFASANPSSAPSGRVPLLGGATPTSSSSESSAKTVFQFGARVLFP